MGRIGLESAEMLSMTGDLEQAAMERDMAIKQFVDLLQASIASEREKSIESLRGNIALQLVVAGLAAAFFVLSIALLRRIFILPFRRQIARTLKLAQGHLMTRSRKGNMSRRSMTSHWRSMSSGAMLLNASNCCQRQKQKHNGNSRGRW